MESKVTGCFSLFFCALFTGPAAAQLLEFPERPVDPQLLVFRKAVEELHEKALRSRKPWSEEQLRKRVPARFLKLEKRYARIKETPMRALALAQLGLVYADLAWLERLQPILDTVAGLDPALGERLGSFGESERFFVRVVGAGPEWVKAALDLGEAAHAGYVKLFGFKTVSKVPGKKIRILLHVDPGLKGRLYFDPRPPFHSELRYEMRDPKELTLAGGRRIVYGFCHELGHMVAMWGESGRVEDDKHAWAHYTGCLVVEEVYERLGNEPWPTWTAFQRQASGKTRLLKQIAGHSSGRGSYEEILALFHTIGEEFGTAVYGRAWQWLEGKKRFRRQNRVAYLWLRDLEEALLETVPRDRAGSVRKIFAGDGTREHRRQG